MHDRQYKWYRKDGTVSGYATIDEVQSEVRIGYLQKCDFRSPRTKFARGGTVEAYFYASIDYLPYEHPIEASYPPIAHYERTEINPCIIHRPYVVNLPVSNIQPHVNFLPGTEQKERSNKKETTRDRHLLEAEKTE